MTVPIQTSRDIKKEHTKSLLKYKNQLLRGRTFQEPEVCPWSYDEIKAELATRPHVQNKQEGKEARRKKAKQKPERRKR